jgi:transposase-like protein
MQLMSHRYPAEQRERATRMALERLDEYGSAWAVAQALGPKLGIGPETLRKWVLQAQVDAGRRSGPTSEELAEIKRLKKENAELREANEILKAASVFFARELCATRRRVDRGGVRDLSRWAVAAAR